MASKFQIFVSSTYDDLKNERAQVLKAILEMGHIPVGMEMFSAADDEQWKIIARHIDECDYYAVILAHRYGSTIESISYTEKEYDYAISKSVPVLGFIIEKDAPWPADKIDVDLSKQSLERFKEKVKRKPVSFWTTAADLHGKFSISLMKQIISTPRAGWIRANEVAGPEVTKELARLSGENAELRAKLADALRKVEDTAEHERHRIIQIMRTHTFEFSYFYTDGDDWEDPTTKSMLEVFHLLAPELMIEKSTEGMAYFLGALTSPKNGRRVRNKFPLPSNSLRKWISDFIALGLFDSSPKRHTVIDTNEYWTLTSLGREVFTQVRREKFSAIGEKPEESDLLASAAVPQTKRKSKGVPVPMPTEEKKGK